MCWIIADLAGLEEARLEAWLGQALEGEIVSNGYPSGYANNLDYNISIHFAHDQFIVLRFIEFRLQNDTCQGESCSSSNISCRSVSLNMLTIMYSDNSY